MSFQTFDKAYLQSMPDRRKQEIIDKVIQGFLQYLLNTAACGKTSYTFDTAGISPTITSEDLVAAFKNKFPDCSVSYQEVSIAVTSFNKVIKKNIVIDWS